MRKEDEDVGPDDDGEEIIPGIELRPMHVGGGQLWDGLGPLDGTVFKDEDGEMKDAHPEDLM